MNSKTSFPTKKIKPQKQNNLEFLNLQMCSKSEIAQNLQNNSCEIDISIGKILNANQELKTKV